MSFYILKRSPDSVVWAATTLARGTLDLFNEDNSLRGENTVADSNPERVLSREIEARLIFKYSNISTSVEYQNRCFTTRNEHSLEPRGCRTTVQPVLPIRSNHCSLRTALHHFLILIMIFLSHPPTLRHQLPNYNNSS
jgi:hypothetical protein